MKIAFFSTRVLCSGSPFVSELEIIQSHLTKKDNVFQIVCNGELGICFSNLNGNKFNCLKCISKREYGKTLLSDKIQTINYKNNIPFDTEKELEIKNIHFSNIDELKKLHYKNFDVGYGVASTLITLLRDNNFDIKANDLIVKKYIKASIDSYKSTKELIKKYKFDRLYVFNGRLAIARAVFRACQSENIDCFILEAGSDKTKYEVFQNHLPHSIDKIAQSIEKYWKNSSKKQKELGHNFYKEKLHRNPKNGVDFVKKQIKSKLPETFDYTKRNFALFNSSQDEFEAIGEEWKNPYFKNQIEGITFIIDNLPEDTHLYIRIHPNLQYAAPHLTQEYKKFESRSNVTVIYPESKIDSYALLKAAEKVITFGSTMGVEAIYWSKPSVLLGKCFYRNLEGVYVPDNHEHIISLLKEDLKSPSNRGALMYGYYAYTYGIKYKYYVDNKFKGFTLNFIKHKKFKGVLKRFLKIPIKHYVDFFRVIISSSK